MHIRRKFHRRFAGIGIHIQSEADGNAGCGPTGIAETDDSHLLPVKFMQRRIPETKVRLPAPLTVPHFLGIISRPLYNIQDMGKGHLRHRLRAIRRNVRHNHSPAGCRFYVYNIISGSQHADVFQIRQLFNRIRIQYHFIGEQHLRTDSTFQHLLGSRPFVHSEFTQCFQILPGQIARVQCISV